MKDLIRISAQAALALLSLASTALADHCVVVSAPTRMTALQTGIYLSCKHNHGYLKELQILPTEVQFLASCSKQRITLKFAPRFQAGCYRPSVIAQLKSGYQVSECSQFGALNSYQEVTNAYRAQCPNPIKGFSGFQMDRLSFEGEASLLASPENAAPSVGMRCAWSNRAPAELHVKRPSETEVLCAGRVDCLTANQEHLLDRGAICPVKSVAECSPSAETATQCYSHRSYEEIQRNRP